MSTRVIAIVNQKGGVGKTTTAANLGAGLAYFFQKKVLLIDFDPQSNLSLHFGVNLEELEKSSFELLLGENGENVNINDIIIKTKIENLDLIPASIKLAGAELELVNVVGRERLLSDALENIINDDVYDFIFIDCSPSLGLLTLNALTTAKEVFITMQADYFALQGIGRLLQTLKLVVKRLNPELEITGIVVCMFNSRRKLSWEILSKIRGYFKEKVFTALIRIDVNLAESPSFGISVFHYAPNSNGAKDYLNLAEEVLTGRERYLFEAKLAPAADTLDGNKLKYLNAKTKIVFIDDDEDFSFLVKEVFSAIGQHIYTFNSYETAVRYLKTGGADVLITDINLPGEDGFELIKWVNRERNLIGLPIIVITGVMRDKSTVIKAAQIGADKFLSKPFQMDRLIKDVDSILDPNLKKKKQKRFKK